MGILMKSVIYKHSTSFLAIASFSLLAVGCGGGGGNNGGGSNGGGSGSGPGAEAIRDLQVDASSYTDTVYIDLETGQTVSITDEQAADSDAWHIGIKRYDFITNSGVSGSGEVGVAITKEPAGFYESGNVVANTFITAVPANYESDLLEPIASDLTYVADIANSGIKTAKGTPIAGGLLDYGWYTYNPTTHQLAANAANNWQIRSGEGNSYAQMKAASVGFNPLSGYTLELSFDVESVGTTGFIADAATFTVNGLRSGELCFDFDSNSEQACDSAVWDVKFKAQGRSIKLFTNSGASGSGSGGAFGPFNDALATALYTSGTKDSQNNDIPAQQYASDSNYSGFNDEENGIGSAIFEYGVNSDPQYAHKLLSNYCVFAVDTDTSDNDAPKYKVQVTNYYNSNGTSGHVSLRILANQ